MTIEYSEDNAQRASLLGDPEHSSVTRFMDTVGDGTGTKDMNAAADIYFIEAQDGEMIVNDEIKITIADAAIFQSDFFGGLGAALSNGCLLQIERVRGGNREVAVDLLDGDPIKTNVDLYARGDADYLENAAGSILSIKLKHKPIRLYGNATEKERLVFETQDSLAGLTFARVAVKLTDYTNNLG